MKKHMNSIRDLAIICLASVHFRCVLLALNLDALSLFSFHHGYGSKIPFFDCEKKRLV